jgi:hypothetical protein
VAAGLGEPDYVGLMCVESPEVRFMDVLVVPLPHTLETTIPIDAQFVATCEPRSIRVVSAVPSVPVTVGAIARHDRILLARAPGDWPDAAVTITISGIRKGRRGVRFPRFTEQEFRKNTQFWTAWQQ